MTAHPPPTDRRRYLSDQAEKYQQFLKAATEYAQHFEANDFDWCYRKPFDRMPGHPYFLSAMPILCGALQVMNLHIGATILEVGSGPGWLTEMLVALGYRVVALDPAAAMHTLSRRRLKRAADHLRLPLPLPVTYLAEPLEECSLPEASVDGVLFYESLHHIVDERAGLTQAFRVLRPGGVLAVAGEWAWVPGHTQLEADIEAEMAEYGTLENPFTHEYLDWLLAGTGFERVARYHALSGFFPIDQGGRTIAEASRSPASVTNCLTARKPKGNEPDTTANPTAPVNASVVIRSACLTPDRMALIDFTVINSGPTVLLAQQPGDLNGFITVSLCHDPDGSLTEAGRIALPQTLAPGQSINFGLTIRLPTGQPIDGWCLALVNEGHHWLHHRPGVSPVPVAFG